jgi:hypothetical protein
MKKSKLRKINALLSLESTLTPAGSANNMAGMTSLNPTNPKTSLLSVNKYRYQPSNTGTVFMPMVKHNLVTKKSVNSLLITRN